MIIKKDDQSKKIEIWIESSQQKSYKQCEEYQKTVSKYKDTHSICVFVGGNKPLLPTISMLLDAQVSQGYVLVG